MRLLRRALSIALLVALVFTAAMGAIDAYVHATYVKLDVVFHQEGLESAGLIQIEVNCSGPYGSSHPKEDEVVHLGWQPRTALITMQARAGAESPYLDFQLIVDGRGLALYRRGERHNASAIGDSTRPAEWVTYRTYLASGENVVEAGCPTGGVPPRRLNVVPGHLHAVRGTRRTLFDLATQLTPILLFVYYLAGVAIFALSSIRQLGRAYMRPGGHYGPGIVAAALAGLIAFSDSLQVSWLRPGLIVCVALGSGLLGIWWLRADLMQSGRAAVRLLRHLILY
jgi:hypothetical protein